VLHSFSTTQHFIPSARTQPFIPSARTPPFIPYGRLLSNSITDLEQQLFGYLRAKKSVITERTQSIKSRTNETPLKHGRCPTQIYPPDEDTSLS